MEFNFDFRRLLLFAILLGGFALLGGFSKPELPPESLHQAARVYKAWFFCMAIFTLGAASFSLVDHWAGTMEPVNLRPVYLILGGVLMLAGGLWLRALKQSVNSPQKVAAQSFMHVPATRVPPFQRA